MNKILLLILIATWAKQTGAAEQVEHWDVSAPDYSVDASKAVLDVEEGTWMNLDVSPDGKHIVFDLLGDLYRIPLSGGKAESLTQGHAWDMQPRFSPDGRSIAFTSDRAGGDNIWVLDLETGELQQVTHESFQLLNNPAWTRDGRFIAARKHFTTSRSLGTGEIWLYHVNANEQNKGVAIVQRPSPVFQKELGEPMFLPDGSGLYYSQNATPGDTFIYHQDSNQEIFQIKKIDFPSGDTETVVGGPGGAVRPTPSPDGKTLAYVKRVRAASRLFLMDLASGTETMLLDQLDQDMQETWAVHGLYPNMDWTPDSKEIVLWTGGRIWRVDIATGNKTNVPFSVQDTRDIYPAPRFSIDVAPDRFATRMVRFAQWSPNRQLVLFESLGRLFIKAPGKPPRRLTSDSADGLEYSPVWSPAGDKIYFLRWEDANLTTLHSVSVRGGKSRQLNKQREQLTELSISPDGDHLFYRKLAGDVLLNPEWGQKPGIYRFDIKAKSASFISHQGTRPRSGLNVRLHVQERGRPVGRGSDVASTRLLSMTMDGHDVREIANSELATQMVVSPDEKYIAFTENHHVYVSILPKTGGPITLATDSKAMPTSRVSEIGGPYLSWSGDAKSLSWSVGPNLVSVDVEAALRDPGNLVLTRENLSQQVVANKPSGLVVFTGARVITMNRDRKVIENAVVVIAGNRISAIAPAAEVAIPPGAKVVDLTGKTIIPGLSDIHAHGSYARGQIIPQQNWSSLAHLALGVTTLHNPSSRATQVFAAAEYARAGVILSPRIFSTGEIIYGAKSTSHIPVDSLDDALRAVRRLKAQGALTVKNYNQPRREQRQQVIEAARLENLMVVAEGGALYHQDMNLIADGITGIEHNVPTLNMYDDVTQFWRQSKAGYTPTTVVTFGGLTSEDYYYQRDEVWKHPILSNFVPPIVLQPRSVRRPMAPESDYRDDDSTAAAKVLLEAGVLVNTGGHGQREGLATHWEMWSMVRGGMSASQAISAATTNPAHYLGMNEDIGSIEVGKLADLVILAANPMTDISNTDKISLVMLNGRLFDALTLNEVETGDARLTQFWWQTKPQGAIR